MRALFSQLFLNAIGRNHEHDDNFDDLILTLEFTKDAIDEFSENQSDIKWEQICDNFHRIELLNRQVFNSKARNYSVERWSPMLDALNNLGQTVDRFIGINRDEPIGTEMAIRFASAANAATG